ncbi:hypothetical protein [Agrobacterium vitis]|uniref:hypothetical protein n=1 Tax=Agrobacterium vitis TaxID=373 RepID=UPI003D2BF462
MINVPVFHLISVGTRQNPVLSGAPAQFIFLQKLAFINRYERPGVLFYFDPPYFGCKDDYGKALFGRDQFEVLAGCLRGLQGRFILSINDRPEIREIFAGFPVEGAALSYSVSGGKGTEVRELIYYGRDG